MPNEYHPWVETDETELAYFRRRFLEESARAERLESVGTSLVLAGNRLTDETENPAAWIEAVGRWRAVMGDAAGAPAAPPPVLPLGRRCGWCGGHEDELADPHGRCPLALDTDPQTGEPYVCGPHQYVEEAPAAPPEPPAGTLRGRCQGCGEIVEIDHDGYSHTRPEHDPACDGSCTIGCPVPVLCGPVTLMIPPSLPPEVQRVLDAADAVVAIGEEPAFDTAKEIFDWTQRESAAMQEVRDAVAALRARKEAGDGT